jgi:diguanylate cyclase (GGDEF)-like protein
VLFYLLMIAVVNVGVGFALAWHLGRRYEAIAAESDLMALGWIGQSAPAPWMESQNVAAPLAPDAMSVADAASPVEAAAAPPESTPLPIPPAAPALDPEKSPREAAVEEFHREVVHYDDQLGAVDEMLRQFAASPDTVGIEACLNSLWDATQKYLENREVVYKQLDETCPQGEAAAVHDGIHAALRLQDAEIEMAAQGIKSFDYQNDLESGCGQMIGRTNHLVNANHQLRDAIEVAMLETARSEDRLGQPGAAVRNDPLTGICSRSGLEAALLDWWRNDPQRIRRLAVAMLDLDQFGRINEQFGYRTGDETLRAIGQLLDKERQGEATVARFAGQRFVFLFPDADVRYTTNVAERLRQLIENAQFCRRDDIIRLTVSCAVTEALPADTAASMFARTEAALHEAKRYGRNRTFLYEGKYPTPVVPPNFSLEQRSITL